MKKPTKKHLICYVLKHHGPLTRVEILRRVYALDPRGIQFQATSNTCYFRPNRTSHGGNGSGSSVLVQGYVKPCGKRGNTLEYGLTGKGYELANEYERWACMF